jgi:hypothetical protein
LSRQCLMQSSASKPRPPPQCCSHAACTCQESRATREEQSVLPAASGRPVTHGAAPPNRLVPVGPSASLFISLKRLRRAVHGQAGEPSAVLGAQLRGVAAVFERALQRGARGPGALAAPGMGRPHRHAERRPAAPAGGREGRHRAARHNPQVRQGQIDRPTARPVCAGDGQTQRP